MISKIKNKLRNHFVNCRGFRTNRKIVVIESDDWGAIRLPSVDLLGKLELMGIKLNKDFMLRYDALASEEDLAALFELLDNFDPKKKPAITANTIVANPDFQKIEKSNFTEYYFEPFTDSLKRYPSHKNSIRLWYEGMGKKIFRPQFHGREHLQVGRWMRGLKDTSSETFRLFDERLYAVCGSASTETRKSYLAAYEWDNKEDRSFSIQSVRDGLDLFESLFGYRSESAIAPNYIWSSDLEEELWQGGVKYLQGGTVQRSPDIETGENRMLRHYMGEKNDCGQRYMIRNCRFEPSSDPHYNWVDNCLEQIKIAFQWRKPAIIESHRVNFIGYIDRSNREKNLVLFEELLRRITEAWPDVEFMTSDQLGSLIDES